MDSMRVLKRSLMIGAAAVVLWPGAAFAEPTHLTVLHFNDVYELSPSGGRGGFAPLMTLLREERADADNHLTLVSGDFLSPSLLSGLDEGANMVAMFNAVDVDYVSLGNHEFDFGPDVLLERMGESDFKWVNTNVLDRGGNPFGASTAMALEQVGNYQVGLIGLLTPETEALSSPGSAVVFAPYTAAAAQAVASLQDQGADVIIALTHLTIAQDRELADAVDGIDVILGGHDHDPITFYEGDVLIHKSGSDAHYLGVIDLSIDTVETRRGPAVAVIPSWDMRSTAGVAPDTQLAALVQRYEDMLDTELNVVVGTTTVELVSKRGEVRTRETNMGNLIADAMREGVGADIAITNGGGIRGDRSYEAGSQLTRRDIQTELPFGNVTVLLELTGEQVLAALENGVSQIEDVAGRFPQVSGLAFSFDASKPAGSRVTSVTVGGRALSPNAVYRVATNDYMAGGGDGYTAFAGGRAIIDASAAQYMASMVIDYIAAAGSVAPKVEGRITEAN
ncbi:MAG: bifunctional metallophosphatase/5'-nucleotidase [Inquilinus sp.]|nr:bifunctional metallophosphatase/5'-nucleotidase [Inquilinus sp.]